MKYSIPLPRLRGNRVDISWSPAAPFETGSYFIEYPDLPSVQCSPGKLMETCLPVCFMLAAVGASEIRLAVRIDSAVLARWRTALAVAQKEVLRRKTVCEIINGEADPQYGETGAVDGLFFGGGTESLLTLARLRERNISPVLISCGGPAWLGSDPEKNPIKFQLDASVASDLGLRRIRAITDFMNVVKATSWDTHLKAGHWPMSSFLFTPFFLSLVFPVCEMLGIGRLIQGHEKMKHPWEFFAFAPAMTGALDRAARGVCYHVKLSELSKEDICAELYGGHPALALYQYSCWKNSDERWCHACENCLRSFLFLKISGLDPSHMGLDQKRLFENRPLVISDTLRSPDCYPDEYWGYLWSHPALRREPELKKLLDEIRLKTFFFKRPYDVYVRMPRLLRRLKKRLIRPRK